MLGEQRFLHAPDARLDRPGSNDGKKEKRIHVRAYRSTLCPAAQVKAVERSGGEERAIAVPLLTCYHHGMKRKVHRIAAALADRLSLIDEVQAVLLGEAAETEVFDPYFTIDLDVYTTGPVPDIAARRSFFPEISSFESSPVANMDRFLVEDLPAGIHYRSCADVDRMLLRISELSWVFHEPGTNALYRIGKSEVLFARNSWLEEARSALAHVPADFWLQARLRAYALAERALSDLGAASHRSDNLYFLVSSARLVRCVASFLFAANRQFEPSDRMLGERIGTLPVLPEGLTARMDTFLRPVGEVSVEGRREIAEMIVRSLMPMAVEERA